MPFGAGDTPTARQKPTRDRPAARPWPHCSAVSSEHRPSLLNEGTTTAKSFRICVSDDVVNDQRTRLARTRFTAPSDTAFWAAGTDPGYLRHRVTCWANGFDWRAAERAPSPLRLIMTHG